MSKNIFLISTVVLILALAAWGLVTYGAYTVLGAATERAEAARMATSKANQALVQQRVHALAESTAESRAVLDKLINADIVAIIDVIDAAGKSAGIQAKVSNAAAVGNQAAGKDSLSAVTFSVQGTGRYADVIHAAKLYEQLPLLSSIEQMDIERVQTGSGSQQWHITARIRVYTMAIVSI